MIHELKSCGFNQNEVKEKSKMLSKYLHKTKNSYFSYMCLFFICSCLFLIIIFLQMFMIDSLLDGQFYDLGFKVFSLPLKSQNVSESIAQIFPWKTECSVYYFDKSGSSGIIQ